MSTDYRSTVSLPQTGFAMRAGLSQREPEILARWNTLDLYRRLRESAAGREKFILHDGPPYANGHLHIGHGLNKILKDVISRAEQMRGKDSNYVPGWDCHGLPIEWKVEEKYRAEGRDKDAVDIVEFRRECREFAEHWIEIQRDEFKRLGVIGDWDHPYTTMNFAAEAQIVRELGKFLMSGALYKGAKPVLWSVVEKTALADAEVEYADHVSTTVSVRFPVARSATPELEGASILIWTTTPWTIPGNRAVAFGPSVEYAVYEVVSVGEGSMAVAGEKLVVAETLAESVRTAAAIESWRRVARVPTLEGTLCRHPLFAKGYEFEVPVVGADFVDVDTGSGCVHIAPGHGTDDWEVGVRLGLEVPETVDGDGLFVADVPLFAGLHVFKADANILAALADVGALLATAKLNHSYPHSWRSKAPLIFRNTPQWFISMDRTGLRETALRAIDETRFVPAAGRNRLRGMIESRPDWCVSRQRAWGVPITVFVDTETGEPLRDPAILERIADAIESEGADVWFTSDAARFLAPEYDPDRFEQVTDIVEVWFDSGSTHSFVLEARDDLKWPASLYLEGSDQHRGWFHSSLLESCGTRGRAPYETVLTHGFVMAEDGQKMSKSLGNIVSPQDVVDEHGADVLRLWVVGSDYAEDLRIGPEILRQHADAYRRLRNTLRFLLGNLSGFSETERIAPTSMPELERWILHRVFELDGRVRAACDDLEFHPLFTELHNFCTLDLSAFYFDVRKDCLYCDAVESVKRRAVRTVLDIVFDALSAWLAPFICFTAEEAWLARDAGREESVHLRMFPDVPADWRNDSLAAKWDEIRSVRRVVTGALEVERVAKRIGASLQADVQIFADERFRQAFDGLDPGEIAITSRASMHAGTAPEDAFTLHDVPGVAVVTHLAEGEKCARCWRVLEDVGSHPGHAGLCGRCVDVVERLQTASA
ncbi:MAG: isoleucine--tRNA ligase [Rhodospirillales bacterium]|jgi:isoleucyl-tRNA synthetase|nr:isoleucine--tRNA ligase [Rhodospirillales bacterium]MDP6804012.1 isoleucine--tRNA ligase [Rhodospirillales bacterium]